MKRTANLGHSHHGFTFTAELREAWPWIWALDAFDYGDPSMLADLVASQEIPAKLRPQIAKIVTGERRPSKKGAAKIKVQPKERMELAAAVSVLVGLYDRLKLDWATDGDGEARPLLEIGADKARIEPIEQKRRLEALARRAIVGRAEAYGICEETVEDLVRTLRKKLTSYPDV